MPLQNTISIKNSNIIQNKYVPICDQDTIGLVIQKIFQKNADTSDFWATLGRQDSGPIANVWAGSIVCSRVGNNSFTNRGRKIQQEAQQLASLYSTAAPDLSSVYEKFISLKDLQLGTQPEARQLRLTIMLDPGEHALAFLQFTDLTDMTSQGGAFEYVLPETVDPVGKKNRLTYLFEVPQTSVDGAFQTVIKVMCYQSKITTASSVGDVKDVLRNLDNPYGIKLFDAVQNTFVAIANQDIAKSIDPNKKTLLFIHGTISTIQKSYGDLYDSGKKTAATTDHTWIQKAIFGGKKYEQVIGFDHPSVVDSPMVNAATLFSMLTPVGKFSKTVDIITSSRGGLVGKCVINAQQNIMTIERAATVACANGVELLTAGENLGRMIGIIRNIDDEPISKAALLVLQLVVNLALQLPGIKIMQKNDPGLQQILAGQPTNKNLRYFPLCGDYSLNGNHPVEWKFVDLLLTAAMKDGKHDWVVETDFQVVVPNGFLAWQQTAPAFKSIPMDTTHLRYFYDPMNTKAKSRIAYFLHDTDVISAKNFPAGF